MLERARHNLYKILESVDCLRIYKVCLMTLCLSWAYMSIDTIIK